MAIPSSFRAGTTSDEWTVHLTDYPTGDGWTVSMILNSGSQTYTVVATEDGSDYAFAVTAATSATWTPGSYAYGIQAAKGGDIFDVCQGWIVITEALGASNAKLTQLNADLVSIDSAIRKVIESGGVKAHRISIPSVSDREYQWLDLAELRRHRIWIMGEIKRCKAELGLASKKTGYRRIKSVLS